MIAIVRIRGSVNVQKEIRRILAQLGLNRPNHVVLVERNDTYTGMLQKVRHLVAYGEPSVGTIERLLRKRGEVSGHGRLTDQYVAETTGFSSIADLAAAMAKGDAAIKSVPMLKATFRCNPPSRGYKSVKRSFQAGGSLGNMGPDIDHLLKRML